MNSLVNTGFTSYTAPASSVSFSRLPAADRSFFYGKVVKTILVKDDIPEDLWKSLGYSQALYGVFYVDVFENAEDLDLHNASFAYCNKGSFRRLPVKNEIVSLSFSFGADISQDISLSSNKLYWTDIVSGWNSINSNLFPSANYTEESTCPEQNRYPLQLLPGDVSIEGRHGQSIRFGGSGYTKQYSPLLGNSSEGNPCILIRNGQSNLEDLDGTHKISSDGIVSTVHENIDTDGSSLYLVSNCTVPLTQSYTKISAWRSTPELSYTKSDRNLITGNTDSLFLNARMDISLVAKDYLRLGADTVGIDGTSYISLDATKIYLGKTSLSETEPVLKGDMTVEWLKNLCNLLSNFLKQLNKAGTDPASLAAIMSGATSTILSILPTRISSLDSLKSKKVFVE